jgi:catechol 2,3-dioxygenase-like lactoylglutathione lyase family enzyme
MKQSLILGLLILSSLFGCSTPGNPLNLSPDHATLSVNDLEREKDWCVNVLGFHESAKMNSDPDDRAYHVSIPGYRLDLIWKRGSSRSSRQSGLLEQGWVHVVFRTSDLEDAYKRLARLKANMTPFKDEKGRLSRIVLHDPEGNEFEIVRPLK